MSEQKYWLLMWAMLLTTVVSIATLTTVYFTDRNTKVVELIQQGADPSTVLCAFDDTKSRVSVCVIAALKIGEGNE